MSEVPEAVADALRADASCRTPTLGPPPAPPPRWPELTWVFMVIAGGIIAGVVLERHDLEYTVNDGSRWNTVYMLTEHGTYRYKANHGATFRKGQKFFQSVDVGGVAPDELRRRVQEERLIAINDDGVTQHYNPISAAPAPGDLMYFPPFPTIDMVKLPSLNANDRYYSSKPPLLPTLLAGVVWLTEKISRDTFSANPWVMMRAALIVAQVFPFMAFIWVVGLYVRAMTTSAYVHGFCVAIAAFATYLTPWTQTLNNHVIAAFAVMFALHAITQIWYAGKCDRRLFVAAGFFAAFAAVNELPAALLLAAVMVGSFIRSSKRTLLWALPASLIPIGAFLFTNYLATGQIRPVQSQFEQKPGPYYYPGSYWNHPQGVDALHEPNGFYLMNILVGHHGFFLLTPILAVGLLGICAQLSSGSYSRPLLGFFVLGATAIVVWFYTYYTSESKNYGGAPQGPRWLFWLIPLWIAMLPPGVELFARWRVTRGIMYFLLLVSVISVGFAMRQPWGTSWAHLLFRQMRWISY